MCSYRFLLLLSKLHWLRFPYILEKVSQHLNGHEKLQITIGNSNHYKLAE